MRPLLCLIAGNYPVLAFDLLGPLTEVLRRSREICGGDIEKFMVILVVAIRTTEHADFARYTPAQLISGEVPVFPGLGTNVRSIADSIGAPKETVRRKVAELLDAGWFVREGNNLYFTAAAYQELAPVREAIEVMAARYYEVVAELLESKAEPTR